MDKCDSHSRPELGLKGGVGDSHTWLSTNKVIVCRKDDKSLCFYFYFFTFQACVLELRYKCLEIFILLYNMFVAAIVYALDFCGK